MDAIQSASGLQEQIVMDNSWWIAGDGQVPVGRARSS